jgi:XTP/dITP diphosphohydrolase
MLSRVLGRADGLTTDGPLVIASHNAGKVREMRALLHEVGMPCVGAEDLGLPEPEETGQTFVENALLKARASAIASGRPALADDSGLCVRALGGAPGIYSARWSGPQRDFSLAAQRIQQELGDLEGKAEEADKAAWFICVLALVWPDGYEVTAEGRVDGQLVFPPRGQSGFGYDPIFIADGETQTFGEMDPVRKEALSHRRKAWDQLVSIVFHAP